MAAGNKRKCTASIRAVFLDRDGVLNRSLVREGKPYPPANLEQTEILPGVLDALTALRGAGFLLIVVTNQPDVARGTQTRENVEAINNYLMERLPLDEVKTCYDMNSETSNFYKPRPGMLLEAAEQYGIDLSRSFMIGDRWRDIGAGKAAGAFTIFLDYGYQERRPEAPDLITSSLAEATNYILSKEGNFAMIPPRSDP